MRESELLRKPACCCFLRFWKLHRRICFLCLFESCGIFLWNAAYNLSVSFTGAPSLAFDVLPSFRFCRADKMQNADAPEVMKVKCGLNLLRCVLEAKDPLEFVAFCETDNFEFYDAHPWSFGSPSHWVPRASSVLFLGYAIDMINTSPDSMLDPDLFHRAAPLISLVMISCKQQRWQLASQSIEWTRLWKGLIQICEWPGNKSNYQKAGVPELVDLVLGMLEACLGGIHSVPEEAERFHAAVMAQIYKINLLVENISALRSEVPNLVIK